MDAAFAQHYEQYGLSNNGFLPSRLPLARLPSPYYAPWEAIIANLPELLRNGQLRTRVRDLDVLSTSGLTTEPAWRRAYVVLAFLTHAYIWGDDPVADVLPPCISVPFLAVSSHLELPPVATYAALNLWNFTTVDGDGNNDETRTEEKTPFDNLNRLQALHTFTGTASESWFYVVSVAMECRAAAILPVLLGAIEAAAHNKNNKTNENNKNNLATVTAALRQFVACIHEVGVLLDRMHERCDPSVFFFQIRPFLAGSKHMAAQGLPNGVFYDEGAGRGAWRQLRGGSNGQSSLLQFFDIALGVEHTSDGRHSRGAPKTEEQGFHEEVRGYMPGSHRRFLEHVAALPSLREFVLLHSQSQGGEAASEDDREMAAAFAEATKALAAFRNKHLSIVTRYIIIPSRQKQAAQAAQAAKASKDAPEQAFMSKLRGLAHVSTHKDAAEMLTGTGGTELLPFLKQTRDETLHAGVFASAPATNK
ncbi:hypothetical protein SCUCBS95973_006020 [Sporothrix curviconia]|uniref:Indoleamine 2,3-dioxygenase n=1 Tax=Sporothrix curviconia TaxID=1260050 RepID=A0ABP0C2R1_9PEZI